MPWFDAFPTAASLVGQWLLGRKYVENWLVWLVVNVVSVATFAVSELETTDTLLDSTTKVLAATAPA